MNKGNEAMKILIISDSHGLTDELQTIAKRHAAEVDMMIHCGDSELETNHPALEGYKVVKGNCDFMGDFEEELLLPTRRRRKTISHSRTSAWHQTILASSLLPCRRARRRHYLLWPLAHPWQ